MKTAGGFYTIPKDRAEWLFETKLDGFERWLGLRRGGCFALFVSGNGVWESHWTCLPRVSGRIAFKFCQEVLPEAGRLTSARKFIGLTPVENKKGLKMARLLGYKPLGMGLAFGKLCLVSIKEIN